MSEPLYERYKDALRRGHIAALRGRHDAALAAYAEAAAIAPDRPLPHSSLGGTYLRLGRAEEAAAAYAAALSRAPRDEASLGGSADALVALDRPVEAAETLDLLADVLDAAGRLPEACEAARRSLELAESRARRRHASALVARLRESDRDAEAEATLVRALRILEEPVGPSRGRASASAVASESPAGADEAEAASEPEATVEPEPDPLALAAAAEQALDAGDAREARRLLLEAALAHQRAGHASAALDACQLALALEPADPQIHLALVRMYLDRGWRGQAADKLVLLGRLVALGDDEAAREAVHAVAVAEFPADERVVAATV